MKGRLFIQFLALIFVSYIQQVMNKKELFSFGSFSGLQEELELFTTVKFSGHYRKITSEITKKQRKILEAFDIDLQTYV